MQHRHRASQRDAGSLRLSLTLTPVLVVTWKPLVVVKGLVAFVILSLHLASIRGTW